MIEPYAPLQPLIEEARKSGRWLHCSYQNLWFSPDQLETLNREGRFRWGPINWRLRVPQEYIAEAEQAAALAQAEADRIRELIGKST